MPGENTKVTALRGTPFHIYPTTICNTLKQGVPGVNVVVTNWFMGKNAV